MNTPAGCWFLLAKVDLAEIYIPLRLEVVQMGVIIILLAATAVLAISLYRRRTKSGHEQTSDLRFQHLVDKAPVAICISRGTKALYANQKYLDIYGLKDFADLSGVSVLDLWAPEQRDVISRRIEDRAKGKPAPTDYEGVGLRRDGAKFPVAVSIAIVEFANRQASMAFITDISERKHAEELLRTSEARFRSYFEMSLVGFAITSIEKKWIAANEKYCRILGYSRQELEQTDWAKLTHPDDLNASLRMFNMLLAGEINSYSLEKRFTQKDGQVVWANMDIGCVRRRDGSVDFLCTILQDITERKKDELHIRHLNRIYAMLSSISQTIVHEKNPQAMLETACRVAVEKGLFRMAWIGMLDADERHIAPLASHGFVDGYLDLDILKVDLHDKTTATGPMARCYLSGTRAFCNDIEHDPLYAIWKDEAMRRGFRSAASFPLKVCGKVVGTFNLYAGEPHFFDDEEVALLDELTADISFALEVNQKEAERLHAERQFTNAFEHAAIGMALAPHDGLWRWLKVNRALSNMLGYTPEELCAKTFREFTHPEDSKTDLGDVQRLIAGEIETYQTEKRYFRKDGQIIWTLLTVSLVRDNSGKPVNFITQIQNITDRRKLEEQYRQSQKMEAIGQLAGGIAHDFNNILAAIMMQSELAMDDSLPETTRESLREILVASERAASLTNQLLLFSRKQVMRSQELDLNDVVTAIAKMLQRVIGENYRLQFKLHPRELPLHADSGMLDQILLNLVVNARDAMPGGGNITVETSEKILTPEAAAVLPEASPGRYVRLQVADAGCGISHENISRIFDPFFTTKEPGKGTGLGLSTVFGIVKQHEGVILVDSRPGKGSTFTILLPAAKPAVRPYAETAEETQTPGGDETILLVEDESNFRFVAGAMLKRAGYNVLEASDGPEAIRLLSQFGRVIDLLLTDIVMPGGISGLELDARFRAENPVLRTIFMSGYSTDIAGQEVILQKDQEFIQKPFSRDELLKIVRRLLDETAH